MPVDKELKSRLTALKRSRRFVRWGESAGLARELRELLLQIEDQVADAQTGCKLIADFYTTDRSVFDRCDDSSGHVGDVYRYDACELFVSYAKRCADKFWLAKLILKTSLKDDYGVRDALVKSAAESYLKAHTEQLNGDHYQFLLPLAETFASLARPLTASLLYRALLDSILRRGRTTTYGHGAHYLRKLDLLAKTVSDWRDIEPHTVYVEQLRQTHGRKTSFWSRYEH